MDAKDLRTATALGDRNDNGNKYAQSGTIQCNKYKPFQHVGSNSSVKVDTPNSRPCAVIGPDRVLPPVDLSEAYFKKASVDPWPCSDNKYHRPPEYVQKIASYQNPARNISPRQTFQENMQRIMVAPTCNTVKINDDTTYLQLPDKNIPLISNSKMSIATDSKYCDVPYSVISTNNDSKTIRNTEICVPNVNPNISRSTPHVWPHGTMNIHPQRPYTSSDLYSSYPEYPSCAGPRQGPRPHRTIAEDPGCIYPEPYYNDSNIRFKPYPNMKEKYQQVRYDYINNYSNPFHPPPFLPHKYDLQKPIPPHRYPGYPHFKYIDSRISEPSLDGIQRQVNQPSNYSIQYHNQVVHPTYGPMLPNCSQAKISPYPPDSSNKQIPSNKLPYDTNNKMYVNYENVRLKPFPQAPDNFYVNETPRLHSIKSQGIMPNYSPMMHAIPHPYYKKENCLLKNYEYANHYKNIKQSVHMSSGSHYLPQFSPNTLATSPDSSASNDTLKAQCNIQEDSGYVSQSSTTSVRSIDSGIQRINDYYGRFDYKYRPVVRNSSISTKSIISANNSMGIKEKKDIDVRQFLQMWNEGDDENISNKESAQIKSTDINYLSKQHESLTNQEQLYVLGLVNVSTEDLGKYQHIQRVSKLPENIKGYTNIELLNQFEEVIESSNLDSTKNFPFSSKGFTGKQTTVTETRPVSPLDVEAKISQSIIHKEVGCNFEIKPCSPKMLNVEIAASVHNILTERTIEKVTNQFSTVINSPMLPGIEDTINNCKVPIRQNKILNDTDEISSCKMKNTKFSTDNVDSIKNNYSVHDLESNSGVCLASLPRLDNDIELNFPEVNQQFINANKCEPIILTSIKDLPDLDILDESNNNNMHIETLTTERQIIDECRNKSTTETEFKKLSQYRKTKSSDPESKAEKVNSVLLRTDSVIIKNPENTKKVHTCISEGQETPINLTSQNEVTNINELVSHETKAFDKEQNKKCVVNETAVDFILYKSNRKYFSCIDSKSELETINNMSPQNDTLKKENTFKDSSSFSNSQDKDLTVSSGTPFTSTNIPETRKSTSIFDLSSKEDSTIYNSNQDSENNKKPENTSEFIEPQVSVPNNTKIKKTDYDIIKDTCTRAADTDICENHKECTITNKFEGNRSPNFLLVETMQENSVSELVEDRKMLEEVQENRMIQNKENDDFNELSLDNTNIDLIKNEITPTDVFLCDKLKEEDILDTESELNNIAAIKDKADNDVNNEADFYQMVNGTSEQSDLEEVPPIFEENIGSKSEIASEIQYDTKLRTDLLLSEKTSCNDDNVSEILKDNNEVLLCDIEKPSHQNHDLTNAILQNYTTQLKSFESSGICTDNKVNITRSDYRDKVGYISKTMYSPWIRKLMIYNEGPCIPLIPSNKFIAINDMIDNHHLQHIINTDNMETNDINNVKNIDYIASTHSDCVHPDLNSKEHKSKINSTVETQYDNIDEISTNTLSNIHHSDESITSKCLDISNEQLEMVSTVRRKSEDELFFMESETNTQYPLSSKNDDSVHTSMDFEEMIVDQSESEDKVKDDENQNNINGDNSHVIKSYLNKSHCSLKRSLSDSAINQLQNDLEDDREGFENMSMKCKFKRKKTNYMTNINDSNSITQKLCNMLQNRRNSISSIYHEENVSICILIDDNCIITEEDEEVDKICYTEYSEDCLEISNSLFTEDKATVLHKEEITCPGNRSSDYTEPFMLEYNQDKSLVDSWVQDVACIETVVSDDIAEDIVISAVSSPKNDDISDNEDSGIYGSDLSEHTEKVKSIYGGKLCDDDAHLVETLYNTPQMDVNKALITREPHIYELCNKFYDTEALEKILSESNSHSESSAMIENTDSIFPSNVTICNETPDNKENISNMLLSQQTIQNNKTEYDVGNLKTLKTAQDGTVHSCESSNDNIFTYKQGDESVNYTPSRSPEVSSTTTEEKNSSILLKITNYKGSITSQINQINVNNNRSCCKFTEKCDYVHSNATLNVTRPLITKAAQKYIPPLKESIRDLKVKLPLPQKRLLKLKQLKLSKDKPKVHNNYNKNIPTISKKPKPKFEDVLKSIDEIQFKMLKENNKKIKKVIPKVVIKKNENGSHYASTSNQDSYNPDLTGRKWQPWVFIEKNNFIDKMAIKKKNKAVFNYRKNTYVLAEKFHKYKSISSSKFFITQQKLNASSTGQLKYTIKLKHNY